MSDIKSLLEQEGEAAEANADAPLKLGTTLTRGHGRSKTLQVRLNPDEYAAFQALAEARDLPLSTMVRSIILVAIHAEQGTPAERIERMRHELDLLSADIA